MLHPPDPALTALWERLVREELERRLALLLVAERNRVDGQRRRVDEACPNR